MKRFLYTTLLAFLSFAGANAQINDLEEFEVVGQTDGYTEQAWIVANPAGSSDFFNTRYDFSQTRTVSSLVLAVGDFGTSSTYPVVGLYQPNLTLDPSGDTPDLFAPMAEVFSPPIIGGGGRPQGDFAGMALPSPIDVPPGTYHFSSQFPPGNPATLSVGADSDVFGDGGGESPGNPNTFGASGFTTDGYSSPALGFTNLNLSHSAGFVPQVDNSVPGSVSQLRVNQGLTDDSGDFLTVTTQATLGLEFAFFGANYGGPTTLWKIFLSSAGAPIAPVGTTLPSLPSSSGSHTYSRVGTTWPLGFGGLTLNFVAVAGAPGVVGSPHVTNEVTVYTLPDPGISWGQWDDGTYENGWVAAAPSGSSDYFNVNYGDCPGANTSNLQVSVMDFGTSVSAYPSAGVAPENTSVDPTGNTPDLGAAYSNIVFTFPALTFVTTSGQLLTHPATGTALTPNTHSYIQFPPGDAQLLGVGADSNSTFLPATSSWTIDAYQTPSISFPTVNFGMRIN